MSTVATLSEKYLKLKRQESLLKAEMAEVKAAILEAVKDEKPEINIHDFSFTTPSKTAPYTVRVQSIAQQRLDSTLLKRDYPEVYMQCLVETTQERFTVK